MTGGNACGFIVTIPNQNLKIWHLGDTAIFSDMKLINDLYTPDIALVPIGEQYTMNLREAAYAVANFMTNVNIVIPMYLSSKEESMDAFDYDGFVKSCEEQGAKGKKYIHPKDFFGGAPLIEN